MSNPFNDTSGGKDSSTSQDENGKGAKGLLASRRWSSSQSSIDSTPSEQAGVKGISAIARVWTTWSLIIAYIGLFLVAIVTSLEGQTTLSLKTVATSAFSAQGLLSTVTLINGAILAVCKPPLGKGADVFGRLEMFTFSIIVFMLGYIQMAAANNVETFASAQIFYAAGSTGLQILQQIFIADTSDLLWRALFSSIPDTPFLATTWIGPLISGHIVETSTWRWGFGLWAIVLPVAFIPLAFSLFVNRRKAANMGLALPSPFRGQKTMEVLKNLWFDLDVFGLMLLCAAVILILLPLTLAPLANGQWKNGSMIAMLVIGCLCLVSFPFWERSSKLAPKAFFPKNLFQQRTVPAGVGIAFFYFAAFYLSVQPFFQSYLMVVQGLSITAAAHVVQVFNFTSTVASIVIGIIIKYTKHYKYFVTAGSCIYMLGIGLMIRYRTPETTVGSLVGCQIAVGIGGGMLNVPAQVGVQASASHQQVAAATAVFLTILEVGGAVGSAISGTVWNQYLVNRLTENLPAELKSQAAGFAASYLTALEYEQGTPTRIAINNSYQDAMRILLIIAICMCIPLIPLSLVMKNYQLDKMDQKVEGKVIGSLKDGGNLSSDAALNENRDVGPGV
ncbi:MAG: hypothetical protein M1831_002203 [Alyxoria varia]|nr:MAG: hypothetical protein M1831_002203 [Alyxoria varia]